MNHITLKKPIIIRSMHEIEESYTLLKNRRSNITTKLKVNTQTNTELKQLRYTELKIINSQLRKIERFLKRYRFITKEY